MVILQVESQACKRDERKKKKGKGRGEGVTEKLLLPNKKKGNKKRHEVDIAQERSSRQKRVS
jgi:hypothetical protein